MFARSCDANSFDKSLEIRKGRSATESKGSPSSVRAAAASKLENYGGVVHFIDSTSRWTSSGIIRPFFPNEKPSRMFNA